MTAKVISMDAHLQKAWADYIAAKERADTTKAAADGLAAGRAWRRWLDLFTTEDQRQKMGSASR